MQISLCDICEENEADVKFKVKQSIKGKQGTNGSGARTWYIGFSPWEKIDICHECYSELMKIKS